MPSTGAAKAKAKSTSRTPPTVITIENGIPSENNSYVAEGGAVRFDNRDIVDYRIRLWTKAHSKHSVIDLLLASLESVTCMTDPDAKKKDDCEYELFETNLRLPDRVEKATSGGGGRIIIGPTPPPKKERR
jgi:hypothetical protein